MKTSGPTERVPVDFARPGDVDLAVRISVAWRKMRRGPSRSGALREYFFGGEQERLDSGQMDTLDVLVHWPTWRMSDLADALHVDPSTATRAVQRLVKEHLAERSTDSVDGRVVIVRATAQGRRLHQRVDERRGFVITELMNAFTPAEREALADLMTRFVDQLDELVRGLPTPSATSVVSGDG